MEKWNKKYDCIKNYDKQSNFECRGQSVYVSWMSVTEEMCIRDSPYCTPQLILYVTVNNVYTLYNESIALTTSNVFRLLKN